MSDQPTLESINEKVEQILTYQKNAHRWAIAKTIINLLLFFVLVVLPIIWAYSLFKTIAGQVDFGKLATQYNQATDLLNQAGQLEGQVKGTNLQNLLERALTK